MDIGGITKARARNMDGVSGSDGRPRGSDASGNAAKPKSSQGAGGAEATPRHAKRPGVPSRLSDFLQAGESGPVLPLSSLRLFSLMTANGNVMSKREIEERRGRRR